MNKIPVSAIILTKDESLNIHRCVKQLAVFDEVIIVDSGSTDDTVELAYSARADVRIFTNPFVDFGQQRNWALDETSLRNDWILFIDADEFMTPALAREIDSFVKAPGNNVGAYIAGMNYFLGKWLKYSTYYPSFQLRLLKKGEVRYRREGHGQREVTEGPLAYLKNSWIHEGFSKGLHQWIARHNDYSTNEVELILRLRSEPLNLGEVLEKDPIRRRRALKRLGARLPFRPVTRFFYTLIIKRGILDGYAGFIFALLRLSHDIHLVAKIVEAKTSRKSTDRQ